MFSTNSSMDKQQPPHPPQHPSTSVLKLNRASVARDVDTAREFDKLPNFHSWFLQEATNFGASIGRSRAARAISSSPVPSAFSAYPSSAVLPVNSSPSALTYAASRRPLVFTSSILFHFSLQKAFPHDYPR